MIIWQLSYRYYTNTWYKILLKKASLLILILSCYIWCMLRWSWLKSSRINNLLQVFIYGNTLDPIDFSSDDLTKEYIDSSFVFRLPHSLTKVIHRKRLCFQTYNSYAAITVTRKIQSHHSFLFITRGKGKYRENRKSIVIVTMSGLRSRLCKAKVLAPLIYIVLNEILL